MAGVGGRVAGVPNRDKAELRALIQDRVLEFTELRRAEDIKRMMAEGASREEAEERAQRVVEDFDPVAEMALMAVDARNKVDMRQRCLSDVAQYVRPKLKSVEVTTDPEALETLAERQELSRRLVDLLSTAAEAKKSTIDTPPPPSPPDEGDQTS